MKLIHTAFFVIALSLIACNNPEDHTHKMKDRFFTTEEFNSGFGRNMVNATDVYEALIKNGLKEYSLRKFDFDFISDTKEKIDSLANFLKTNYGYTIHDIKREKDLWRFNADTKEFPVDDETILFWLVDLYVKGYNFDCKLDGFGNLEPDEIIFPNLDKDQEDIYFNKAIVDFENQNYGSAIINWTTALKINPNDPNSYYSRAIAKNELYTWKAALKDYDKAIELSPSFTDAIVNRATVKDESGDYNGAIEDYNKAIEIDAKNSMAYFNRGNSKFNKGDKTGACQDWHKAKSLGADYAKERIDKECK